MVIIVIFIACIFSVISGQEKLLNVNDEAPVEHYELGKNDLLLTRLQRKQLKTRSALLTVVKWPNGVIPYVVSDDFKRIPSRMAALNNVINDYNYYTCIRLVPRTNERNYLRFINDDGCYSYLGVNGGAQDISYGEGCDTNRGTPLHEIMHALGFMHEQQRPDRDSYVTVNANNLESGVGNNFDKYKFSQTNLAVGPYDLASIMHYPRWAFSRNGQDTIVTKDSRKCDSKCTQFASVTSQKRNENAKHYQLIRHAELREHDWATKIFHYLRRCENQQVL